MEPPETDESDGSDAEQSVGFSREHDPRTMIDGYLGLLKDVPHIDDTPEEANATIVELLKLLANAYAMAILYYLFCENRPLRFTELEDALGVSPIVLSQRLSEFVEAGLVSRTSYDEIPPRVEYEPTTTAEALDPAFQFLYTWADHYDLEDRA